MKRLYFWAAAIIAVPVFLSSCSKDPLKNMSESDSRIYVTQSDTTANFSAFKTYSIVDSVAVIANNRLESKAVTDYDLQVIAAVKSAMQQRGYTLVTKAAQPDLGINVSRITNTSTGVMSYPDYWGYYNSYYDPYYWGYPGYGYYSPYSSYGVYQITEGGLSIEMLDLKDATKNNNKIGTVWTALARGSGVFRAANAASQVDAFFSQSPYLKTIN